MNASTGPDKSIYDFFVFYGERMSAVAPESTLKKGLAIFKGNGVFDLGWDDNAVWGMVEDPDSESPCSVELGRDGEGNLEVACGGCGDNGPLCEHAAALLYRCAAQVSSAHGSLRSAVDAAIEERVAKAKTEVLVKQLSGDSCFGTWQAWSITSPTHWKQVYQVQIRSVNERLNYCTCPDLATNRLGTCKHIEAVLHKIKKDRAFKKRKVETPPVSFVHLAWESATHPQIRVHRSPALPSDLGELVESYFDSSGAFKGQMPEDFFRFADAVYGRDDLQ